ncbi:MAG: DUF3859 domain-containing protein [Blastocatellia bacterium]|nr:DUF3859 domain-containing protein [Blastocatellia bacterium]
MEKRLTQTQLAQVVAEVTRLSQERENHNLTTLGKDQVESVLKELNLPVDLLDDAMHQLQVQDQQKSAQKRRQLVIAGIVAAIFLFFVVPSVVGVYFYVSSRSRLEKQMSEITTSKSTLVTATNANEVNSVNRQENSELRYKVTLQNAPVGEKLSMSCNWYTPSGTIANQNSWKTKTVDRAVWPTECKCKIDPSSPVGEWKVEMLIEGRTISTEVFRVE